MLKKTSIAAVFAATLLSLTGCMHESGPVVALVDLDAIARQVGRSEVMTGELKALNDELTQSLQAEAEELKVEITTSLQALSASPTNEGKQRHQQLLARSSRALEESKRAAALKVNEKRKELIVTFRRDARPAVEKIARERGATLVLTTADNVLWADKTLNITAEVLAAMGGPKTN